MGKTQPLTQNKKTEWIDLTGNGRVYDNATTIALEQASLLVWEQAGMNASHLMLMAAHGTVNYLIQNHQQELKQSGVDILAGAGNNGGDGLAVAWLLANEGYAVRVWLCFNRDQKEVAYPANHFLELCQKNCPQLLKDHRDWAPTVASLPAFEKKQVVLLIDALLGTGFQPPLREKERIALNYFNAQTTISLDIPSGMFADGHCDSGYARSEIILSFQNFKPAHFSPKLADHLKKIVCLPIGISQLNLLGQTEQQNTIEEQQQLSPSSRRALLWLPLSDKPARQRFISDCLAQTGRPATSHKYSNGSALMIAGSPQSEGAFILAQAAFYQLGGGLLWAPCQNEEIRQNRLARLPHLFYTLATEKPNTEMLKKFPLVCLGPGLFSDNLSWDLYLLDLIKRHPERPDVLLDAGGLDLFIRQKNNWDQSRIGNVVLTPHLGEVKRLESLWQAETKNKPHQLNNKMAEMEPWQLWQRMATDWQVYLIVKGHHTVVCDPTGNVIFWPWNQSTLAVGGSGDTLAGLLCYFIGRTRHLSVSQNTQTAISHFEEICYSTNPLVQNQTTRLPEMVADRMIQAIVMALAIQSAMSETDAMDPQSMLTQLLQHHQKKDVKK